MCTGSIGCISPPCSFPFSSPCDFLRPGLMGHFPLGQFPPLSGTYYDLPPNARCDLLMRSLFGYTAVRSDGPRFTPKCKICDYGSAGGSAMSKGCTTMCTFSFESSYPLVVWRGFTSSLNTSISRFPLSSLSFSTHSYIDAQSSLCLSYRSDCCRVSE